MNRSSFRIVVGTAVVASVLTWWLATSPSSPVNPNPPRPIVSAIAKLIRTAARIGLWVALAGEEQPKPAEEKQAARAKIVQADGGIPRVDHTEGW